MPSYITVFRASSPEQLAPFIALIESLLGRRIAAGITIRNLAAVPRTGHLYVFAEAPEAPTISRLFTACGLVPLSIVQADNAKWGRLIGAATMGNHWGVVDSILGPVPAPAGLVAATATMPELAPLQPALGCSPN